MNHRENLKFAGTEFFNRIGRLQPDAVISAAESGGCHVDEFMRPESRLMFLGAGEYFRHEVDNHRQSNSRPGTSRKSAAFIVTSVARWTSA
jgi:hypothetical protein